MPTPQPFEGNAEFLDAAFDALQVRVQRLVAERELRVADAGEVDDRPRIGRSQRAAEGDEEVERVAVLIAREERHEEQLRARLEAHRGAARVHRLGLDLLTERHDLTEDMRLILVAITLYALSEERGERVFGDLGCGMYGTQCVEGLMRLLDAQSVADRIRLRRLFRAESPLVRGGLIELDLLRTAPVTPEDLLGCRVRITESAFATLVGEAPALTLVGA